MKWEEFKGEEISYSPRYVETDIECPACGERIFKDQLMIMASMPPKHKYVCLKCGWGGIK